MVFKRSDEDNCLSRQHRQKRPPACRSALYGIDLGITFLRLQILVLSVGRIPLLGDPGMSAESDLSLLRDEND